MMLLSECITLPFLKGEFRSGSLFVYSCMQYCSCGCKLQFALWTGILRLLGITFSCNWFNIWWCVWSVSLLSRELNRTQPALFTFSSPEGKKWIGQNKRISVPVEWIWIYGLNYLEHRRVMSNEPMNTWEVLLSWAAVLRLHPFIEWKYPTKSFFESLTQPQCQFE